GFNYGAFWPNQTGKTYDDFLRQFKLAQNLPNAPVRFDSAHLFTCIQFGTQNEPISAFKAAIDTNTSLLLGLWGPGNETAFTNELSALDNALTQYGKDLSNLIIGVSVGGEDIHRKEAAADDIGQKIQNLKATFSSTLQRSSSYSALFSKPPPIGHSDIVPFATDVKDVDFIGTTVYPYWNNDSIVRAVQSFSESLSQVQSRANGTEIWITETGWPVASQADQGAAKAGVAELQKYWRDVGCTLFGKVNTWWFELEQDTDDHEGINWSIVDPQTGQPRIDLTC
ncbi:glycoside hydrolase, partial [Polyplosphaeria fusca]